MTPDWFWFYNDFIKKHHFFHIQQKNQVDIGKNSFNISKIKFMVVFCSTGLFYDLNSVNHIILKGILVLKRRVDLLYVSTSIDLTQIPIINPIIRRYNKNDEYPVAIWRYFAHIAAVILWLMFDPWQSDLNIMTNHAFQTKNDRCW